ncbi:MAG: FHA domain-containing protein [Candidatus Obscuribacterales bacterium]|nr:FHA domain-containing protein [Candidatus Obscuribacterales bacterium]
MSDNTQAVLVNVFTNQHFSLKRPTTIIGRASSSDIVLKDILVSREHAVIHFQGDDYYVEDQESTNGTIHNNDFLQQRAKLNPGDRIRIGTTWFTFALEHDVDAGITTGQLKAGAGASTQAQSAVSEFKSLIAQYRKRFLAAH